MKITARSALPARTVLKIPACFQTLVSIIILIIVSYLVIAGMAPPEVVPASSPQAIFSAARAYEHLKIIARAPHPTGSEENVAVRSYLIDTLKGLGLQPEIQTGQSVYHDTGKWGVAGVRGIEVTADTWSIAGATIHNVTVRIPGTKSTGAILLAAHYDSVPYGPGASDDGAGVAAILETARALQSDAPLRNDVILLFTDGEEIGLMGSQVFAEHHPWMNDVVLVLNLEARGSSGSAIMYESSTDNSWLISEYAKAAKDPLTSSLATDVWRLMPNSSDLTAFLEAGKQGMNFAYTENWTDYHTTHDSLEDLDLRSLQHHGDNLLALVRQYGNLDLTSPSKGDAIFFSVLQLGIIHYPKSWATPLMAVAALASLVVFVIGFRKKEITFSGLGMGVLSLIAAMVATALAAYVGMQGVTLFQGNQLQVGMGGTYDVHLYELGLLIVYIPITASIYSVFRKWARPTELAAGALIFWLVLTIISTLILPGGSYLFVWPLISGILVISADLAAAVRKNGWERLLALIPICIGLILFGTAIYLVQRMFGVAIFPAGAAMIVLLLALGFPYIDFRSLPRARVWLLATTTVGLALLVWTGLSANDNPAQPRQNIIFYSMDADQNEAVWVAETELPDETLSPWLGDSPREEMLANVFPGQWEDLVWINDAPDSDQPAPEMIVLEDTIDNGIRYLRLQLISPREAWGIMADIHAEGAILEGELYGEHYSREEPRDNLFFKVLALPPDGVEIGIQLLPGVPVTIRLADVSPSLPTFENQPDQEILSLRTGYGGGHGVDSMTLIHRRYILK